MKRSKILTSLTRLSDASLVQKTELIISSLTNNSFFLEPKPAITEVETALNEFNVAITKAKEAGKVELAIKVSKRNTLLTLLNTLALYVQLQGNDNEVALLSSGFSMRKKPQPIGMLSKPENFIVTPMHQGMVKLSLKVIYGAIGYQYEYREKNTINWIVITNTKTSVILNHLESGVAYEFRVAAMGANPKRIYSETISSFIL